MDLPRSGMFFLFMGVVSVSGTASPIPILPCLDTQSILNDPRDILAYIIRYYVTAPKSVSDTTPFSMISLADDISRYQNSPSTIVSKVTEALQQTLANYFPKPDASASVDVTTSDNGDGSYNLTIRVAASTVNGTFSLGADVGVGSTGILQLKFHPNLT